ncbi:ImmA/IrrE family metallo-endopeptidase [Staphylococcus ureilyticus]|uniref:ImmA/IrrE family metallo-endopeptidase n=1 Tax=Staphylococcus ureilyticus TaxID=94138 RepID=UPI0021D1B514|nr:ImmA/IrrE family metallo-endopeptidase [Staphylococcus ureilyticus]UXS60981.1 ImmA/IrrE family metallo-endopeptidase [Staphylococcus ureilyticus]
MLIDDTVNDLTNDLIKNDIAPTIDSVSDYLDIIVVYNDYMSCNMNVKGYKVIYIKTDDSRKMWEDFTHELGHFYLHETDQRHMHDMFNEKQENEANKFSLLFRLPQIEIEQNELFTENELMEYFNVSYDVARQRLIKLCNYYCNDEKGILK